MEKNGKKSANSIVGEAPITPAYESKMQLLKTANIEEAVILPNEAIKPPKQNLEVTMQIIEDLNKKKNYRNRLLVYAEMLTKFDVEQKEEDMRTSNHYGCKLTIEDDKRETFELKNPTIIKEVIDFLASRFLTKMSEIEAQIVLP